jgi:signal transduction histidine kinase
MDEERGLDFVTWTTWLAIAIPSVVWEVQHGALATPRALAWLACYIAFIVIYSFHDRARLASSIGQALAAIVCCYLQPAGFQPILLVIVAAQLSDIPIRTAIAWVAAQTLAIAFAFAPYGKGLPVLFAYFAFQLFGLLMSRVARKERVARQALAEANAELHVATELLDINSRTQERLRIARDVHDLLGHHLAALSINLEVARHLADGEAREQIEKSQAITKLLLSDVRDVVSRMREDEPVDVAAAIRSLGEVIQRPSVHLEVVDDLSLNDPAVAQVALRAVQEIVTNAVRHSGAKNLWLKLTATGGSLAIAARDDGCGTDAVLFGNGLRGMRERVEEAKGSIEIASARGHGFEVHVRLPLTGATSGATT